MDPQKIYNFKEYIEENLLKYVRPGYENNALLNLGLLYTMPSFLVVNGIKNLCRDKTHSDIITKICEDYYFDYSLLNNEEKNKVDRYIEYFKKFSV